MLVISIGMPRAGSGWHYNLIHDLVVAGGGQDARQVRRRFRLEGILTEVNCNIGALTPRRLLAALVPSLLGNTYVVKAHAGPTPLARRLLRLGQVRATYIYRDPRDALLSSYEHGQRSRQAGHENAFARLETFPQALDFMVEYVRIWQAWIEVPQVLSARYEDLLQEYDAQAGTLLGFLGLDGAYPAVRAVIEKYRPEQSRASEQRGLHFRKGKIGRFRQVFSAEEQAACAQAFAPYLERMGYPLKVDFQQESP